MSNSRRWDRCVCHRGQETQQFVAEYLGTDDRQALLIAGGGFDPRTTAISEVVSSTMGDRVLGLFIREERPNPEGELVDRAERNVALMTALIPNSRVVQIQIFAPDGAVTGGRQAASMIHDVDLDGITDVLVDSSAISTGIAFPLVRHLLWRVETHPRLLNLHLLVTDEPVTDQDIVSTSSDRAAPIHGFHGGLGLEPNAQAAKLWFPQLISGQRAILERIHSYCDPHDVCPILPFPSSNPRFADELIEEYQEQFDSQWKVDARNIVYADERNPLDLYRTILRIDDARKRVFAETGGSLIILSPLGSKVLAMGALMCAIERDFPVVHVESVAYAVDFKTMEVHRRGPGELVHVWLSGEAYSCRPEEARS